MKFLFSQASLAEISDKINPIIEIHQKIKVFFCVTYCCFEAFWLVRKCVHNSSCMSVVPLGELEEGI